MFRTRRLQRAYEESSRAIRLWGPAVARKYVQRVEALCAAQNFGEITRFRAFGAHTLEGKRQDQWPITLTGRWRLIVTVSDDGETVKVEEVTNHYGD